jgi:hypothetical protein
MLIIIEKPEIALPRAIAFMSDYGVRYKDMEWRHLRIIPFVPQSESGKGLCVVYSFIDLGQVEFITESNRVEAESSMVAARDHFHGTTAALHYIFNESLL